MGNETIRRCLLGGMTLLAVGALPALAMLRAQTQHQAPMTPTTSNPFPDMAPGAPPTPDIMRRAQEMRNEERQKRLVADTDKLLSLATQLQSDVSKTNRNVLSMDVIRRADEIEKLAHAVKERMKG